MDISFNQVNKTTVVALSGWLDAAAAPELKQALAQCLDQASQLVIDFSQVAFIDSTGLGTLISFLKNVEKAGKEMRIACLQGKPLRLFEMTRAYKIFAIHKTVDLAIKSFSP